MTPRGTDWSLAALVLLGCATGALTLFAGSPSEAWVFAVHGICGLALAAVVGWKVRRVWPRMTRPARWDARTGGGLVAVAIVALALLSGVAWASGADVNFGGYGLLNWHFALGAVLGLAVLGHALLRAKRPRRRDLAGRRQLLATAGVGVFAVIAWRAERSLARLLGARGADRRFTGSYEAASFQGNAFPATSWVADAPRPLEEGSYRLRVDGMVADPLDLPLAALQAGDELAATLDCTGGFYSTQRWSGAELGRLLDLAAPLPAATHLRVVSITGYRWSFALEDARSMLLATSVSGEALSHDHGAPARLVAPGRRGFQWVKWVTRLELGDGPDPGAAASTVWSSFTPEGRGSA